MEETYIAQTETTPQHHFEEKPKRSLPRQLLIIIPLVLIFLLGTGAFFLNQQSSTTKNNSTSQSLIPNKNNSNSPEENNKTAQANWNTYTSPTKAFSFKYPSDGNWIVPISAPDTVICKKNCPKPYNIFNFTSKRSDKNSIEQFLASLNTTNPNLYPYISDYKLITINGVNAVEALIPAQPGSNTGPTVEIYIVVNGVGYIYTYTYLDPSLNTVTKIDNLPDPNPNILSTLQVGNQTSTTANITASWKVYTNSTLGVTLQYPPTWFVKEANSTNPCATFSNNSDPSPSHSTSVVSLCQDQQPLSSADLNNASVKIIVNSTQGILVNQNSNWGMSKRAFFTNPKGGTTSLGILYGDYNLFSLMLSTFKFQ